MASDGQRRRTRIDGDGVRVTRTYRVPVAVPAAIVLALTAWLVVRTTGREAPREAVPPDPAPAGHGNTPPPAEAPAAPVASAAPDPERHERMRARREERRTERRAAAEPTYTLNAPGEHAGLEAFPPPGTKPIKRGLVVPDDVELPAGYVRHYQTTDDGRRLPPILMFHPDYQPHDADGNPIPLPEDRVVPPDMAPPGMPRTVLDPDGAAPPDVGRAVRGEDPARSR
jgi:hypothetical protein